MISNRCELFARHELALLGKPATDEAVAKLQAREVFTCRYLLEIVSDLFGWSALRLSVLLQIPSA